MYKIVMLFTHNGGSKPPPYSHRESDASPITTLKSKYHSTTHAPSSMITRISSVAA